MTDDLTAALDGLQARGGCIRWLLDGDVECVRVGVPLGPDDAVVVIRPLGGDVNGALVTAASEALAEHAARQRRGRLALA
jgi:hypothetical protein